MHFGENQLSPNSISFSLLSAPHPRLFQQATVGSSTTFHRGFNLDTDRSSGFGSVIRNLTRCSHSISLRLQRSNVLTLLRTTTRRLILQKAYRYISSPEGLNTLRSLVGIRVQVFSLPSRGAFHLSLTVLFTTGHLTCLALEHGRPRFSRNFTCSDLLRN